MVKALWAWLVGGGRGGGAGAWLPPASLPVQRASRCHMHLCSVLMGSGVDVAQLFSSPALHAAEWTEQGSRAEGTMQRASRLKRELSLLATEPPPGITCWQDTDQMGDLRARRCLCCRPR